MKKKWAGGGFISHHQGCRPTTTTTTVLLVPLLDCLQSYYWYRRRHHLIPPSSSSTALLTSAQRTTPPPPSLKSLNNVAPSVLSRSRHFFDSTVGAAIRHSSTSSFLVATTPDANAFCHCSTILRHLHTTHLSSSSTAAATTRLENDDVEKQVVSAAAKKKSPHSKLLRVCSSHNANAHFAAIEADLLRLNWNEAMDKLVKDWTTTTTTSSSGSSRNYRYGDFVELERNVTNYVSNNLKDCWHYHGHDCGAGDDDAANDGKKRAPLALLSRSSLLRLHLFPYERVITSAVHRAIIVPSKVGGTLSTTPPPPHADAATAQNQDIAMLDGSSSSGSNSGNSSSTNNNNKQQLLAAMTELHQRTQLLSHASQLLDAMSKILRRDADIIDDDDGDDVSPKPSSSSAASSVPWTDHHGSCSNCHRLLVSGWFILYRQWKELNRRMLEDPLISAKDIFEATSMVASSSTTITNDDSTNNAVSTADGGGGGGGGANHPQRQVHIWTKRWLDFCQYHHDDRNNVVGSGGGDSFTPVSRGGGILKSDRALLDGIVSMLTSSSSSSLEYYPGAKNEKYQREHRALRDRINNLFSD